MIDPFVLRLWLHRALFLAIAAALVFVQVLPLHLSPERWPAPDMLLAVTLVWVMRRPDYVPLGSVVLVFLVADILLQRPPGLWTALIVGLTEFIRGRLILWRDWSFPLEWMLMTALIFAVVLLNRLILGIFLVPQVGLSMILIQAAGTAVIYPLVVGFAVLILRIRRVFPGDLDVMSGRI